ncbi:hypothetical protein [Roseomonas genomospecies 6]|uniref:Uncharacterized protein n=1 Tax=Roseomonas genomospecies 6 TaxID=214106 RepID=A0A9W7KSW2_9PROT|nr:hypothetical protein [Roseomonas genomospecies 6]KAA0678092.1 hypothetical protein DS843_21150 [Roseomonas genomospecies 6]
MTNTPPSLPAAGLSVRHFANYVVRPTLGFLGDGFPGIESEAAVELILGTAAQESQFRALDQITGSNDRMLGPAYGLFQIEPATWGDLRRNYLAHRLELNIRVTQLLAPHPATDVQLVSNLAFAVAIARLIYYRSPIKLARAGDVEGHAAVWKQVYNTPRGKGRPEEFVANYRRLVAPSL